MTDFEKVAKNVLPEKSWVNASSSAATGLSMKTNLDDWSLINFRPRILRSVDSMDTRRNILGTPLSSPISFRLWLGAGLAENARDSHGENDFTPEFGSWQVPGSVDGGLTWVDLDWISSEWDGPLVLRGIQSVEDVKLAVQHGVQGILLSNRGGRQILFAPSSLMPFLDNRTYYSEAFDKLQVFVDGGLRDGADILKALCLGTTAVGVGRP
ncbi:hypothetical protein PDIDSM_8344 [Penicillium digitatum]|nr:hypothetical protein PDIDSM_8344 [Penicillium digitatum]